MGSLYGELNRVIIDQTSQIFEAVKDIKKEVIILNGEQYPVGPRVLDKAIQDMKRALARHLKVRDADASQMAITIISKSVHSRSKPCHESTKSNKNYVVRPPG